MDMFRHRLWSLLSPQPPFPLRNFVFFIAMVAVCVIRLLGNKSPDRNAITCCTLEITWFDSQFFFLWWTPLCKLYIMNILFFLLIVEILNTIHQCEKLVVLLPPLRVTYVSDIVAKRVAATSPNCNRRTCKNVQRMEQLPATLSDWMRIPYYVCCWSMASIRPRGICLCVHERLN